MPLITEISDFQSGEHYIPNVLSGNAGEGVNKDFTDIQTKYERDVLLKALGKTQYNELQTALGDLPNAAQKWKDLVNGKDDWGGLKPILKGYIYCHWLRFDEVKLNATGAGKDNVTYSSTAEYNQKYVERWNEMIALYGGLDLYETSLYEFLRDTDGLLEDEMEAMEFENSFGL